MTTATTRLDPEALKTFLDRIKLRHGTGQSDSDLCVMQAVDYISSGGLSDKPECASPALTDFMIGLNDRLNDTRRQRLKKFIPQLVGTRGTQAQEQTRRYMMRDWAVRKFAPTWFELAGFPVAAQKLRDLPEVLDEASKDVAVRTIQALRGECFPDVPYYAWYSSKYYSRVYDAVHKAVTAALKAKQPAAATAAVDDAATAATAAATATDDAIPEYGTKAYWDWRAKLKEAVRAAVLERFESTLGPALERNMVLTEELIERLIAVGREAKAA